MIHAAAKYSNVVLSVVGLSVLARLLTPREFGVVAVANAYLVLFTVLADMGLTAAIIQNRRLEDPELAGLFRLSLAVAVVLQVVFCVLGIAAGSLYARPQYAAIFCLSSLAVLCTAMNVVPNAILLRDHRFSELSRRLVGSNAAAIAVSFVAAALGASSYALVLQIVVQSVVLCVLNIRTTWRTLGAPPSVGAYSRVRTYSLWQVGFSTINYFERNLDNLIIGIVFGGTQLAFYDRAYRLMTYPVANVAGVISPVLHPILARESDNPSVLGSKYLELCRLTSIAGAGIAVVCYTCAAEIVRLVLGPQWDSTVDLFRYLSIAIWPVIVMSTTGPMYQSLGRTDRLFTAGAVNAIVTAAAVCIGAYTRDVVKIAMFVAIASYCNLAVTFSILLRSALKAKLQPFARLFAADFAVMAMVAAALHAVFVGVDVEKVIESFALKAAIGCGAMAAYAFLSGRIATIKSIQKWE